MAHGVKTSCVGEWRKNSDFSEKTDVKNECIHASYNHDDFDFSENGRKLLVAFSKSQIHT